MSVSEIVDLENAGPSMRNPGKGKLISSHASNGSGNPKKSMQSGGLMLRNINTQSTDATPAQKSQKKAVNMKSQLKVTDAQEEQDDIEFMPCMPKERDNFEDILPYHERPTADKIRRIFSIYTSEAEEEEENLYHSLSPKTYTYTASRWSFSESSDWMVAEPITEEFEPCSLPDEDFVP